MDLRKNDTNLKPPSNDWKFPALQFFFYSQDLHWGPLFRPFRPCNYTELLGCIWFIDFILEGRDRLSQTYLCCKICSQNRIFANQDRGISVSEIPIHDNNQQSLLAFCQITKPKSLIRGLQRGQCVSENEIGKIQLFAGGFKSVFLFKKVFTICLNYV